MEKKDVIESLSPLEHVRLRPGVYCGDTSNPNQLLLEVFSNALDMHTIGYGDYIEVYVDKNNGKIIVQDHGKGFPINEIREDGLTTLEASFSVMNTSGKFSDDGLYEGNSLGLNGMGSKICTFLSHYLDVVSSDGKNFERVVFEEGVFTNRVTGKSTPSDSGTTVTFTPSEEFFTTIHVDEKYFEKFFNDIACLCPGLKIKFNEIEISHPNGIQDLLDSKIGNSITIINNPMIVNVEGKQTLNLGLTYTGNSSSSIVSYVNYGATESGPHITTIKAAITRTLNAWAKENKLLKDGDKNLDGPSLQEGLILVFNLVTTNVGYNAQVKNQIVKIDTSFVNEVFVPQFELWLDNNPDAGTIIIESALVARKAAEAAKRARARVKNDAAKKEKVFKLPTKLIDCNNKDRSKCELLICEGKSAASGLVAARDSDFQAVYGVRGKMLSVLKATPEKILANQEINNIIQALGLECDSKTAQLTYDENRLRYGKIIACADADPDGMAIENLLFNILWYLCPELVINGHVYSSIPPLFRVTTKKNEYVYLKDAQALAEYQKTNAANIKVIGRNKGLGEQDSEELSDTLLNPESRNIVQLTVNDIGLTDNMFEDLYGKDVKPRVEFLLKHSEEAEYDYE